MMNSYDNNTLYAYLLDSLPDEDTERLDELTFTNSNFADSVDAAEKDLIDSYVNGELTAGMLERFESHYLASPIRRQKVQLAMALQGFGAKHLSGYSESLSSVAVGSGVRRRGKIAGFFESLAAWGGGQPIFPLAAATAVLVLVGVTGLILVRSLMDGNGANEVASTTNQGQINAINSVTTAISPSPAISGSPAGNDGTSAKPTPSNSPQPTPKPSIVYEVRPTIATVTLLPPLRGGQKLVEVPLTPQTDAAAFTINLESADYTSYNIELVDQSSGRSIWRFASAKSHGKVGSASLNARVPAKLLRPSVYSFSISGISKQGIEENIGDYPFRVVR